MSLTPEDVTEAFEKAKAAFPPILAEQTYLELRKLKEAINTILADLPRESKTSTYGLLGLSKTATEYTALTTERFKRIGTVEVYDSTIPLDAKVSERLALEAKHKRKIHDSKIEAAAERGMKNFIVAVVDDVWINEKKHRITKYAGVKGVELLTHLKSNYGSIHSLDITELQKQMDEYFDISAGMPRFIEKMEDAKALAEQANKPIPDHLIVTSAITQMYSSGFYTSAFEKWEELKPAQQISYKFKKRFKDAHKSYERNKNVAAKKMGYGLANAAAVIESPAPPPPENFYAAMTSLESYMDNLAAAKTNEKATLMQLVENNKKLVEQLTALGTTYSALAGTLQTQGTQGTQPATQSASG